MWVRLVSFLIEYVGNKKRHDNDKVKVKARKLGKQGKTTTTAKTYVKRRDPHRPHAQWSSACKCKN